MSTLNQMNTLSSPAIKKLIFTGYEISEITIREENREYNPYEWDKTVSRYLVYGAKFYKVPAQGGYGYNRYFAIYNFEGIQFMHQVSYASCLSSNGFCEITIEDGNFYRHLINCGGKFGRAANTPKNRLAMSNNGKIYSNEF